ncbi:MAG: hypothetical protein A2857_02930 [Candidatus Levybacteria bacterium RIFCSPHIGHO2_01_FULL_36_15]|nr:MAG: hypothetical protein A2857_02930 [Candidatus Levybacteria bacterium RIFCSPHIGHO2_01_FULL_36_15]OGH38741.1 MAG: hypothetical protein A2905_06755 [Candidatus Levybacteria bacterium RIFCSPLOWO2_01_FULL_36_10]
MDNDSKYLTFLKKEKVSADAYSFYFAKPEGFEYLPGQYIRIVLEQPINDGRGNMRFFTLTSSPTENNLIITTRIIQSSFKKNLVSLYEGAKVAYQGPYGNFVFDPRNKRPRVYLAGGIGVTPFRSMALYARDKNITNISMTIIASFSLSDDIIYMDEFKNLKEKLNNFDYIVTVTKPELSKLSWDGETGRIDAEKIKKYVSNISGSYYFIAGPSVMVSALSEVLKTLNIDRENIKTENFPGY